MRGADTTSDIRSEKTELIKPAAKGRNSRRRGAEIKNVNLRDWKPQSRHGGPPQWPPSLPPVVVVVIAAAADLRFLL